MYLCVCSSLLWEEASLIMAERELIYEYKGVSLGAILLLNYLEQQYLVLPRSVSYLVSGSWSPTQAVSSMGSVSWSGT